jgi:hypothetical protein
MPPQQPAVNHRRLVSTGVVDAHVDVERGRHRPVGGAQELPELPGSMALMKLTDDFTTLGIQGREGVVGSADKIAWSIAGGLLLHVSRPGCEISQWIALSAWLPLAHRTRPSG